jgi:hypothetical protein
VPSVGPDADVLNPSADGEAAFDAVNAVAAVDEHPKLIDATQFGGTQCRLEDPDSRRVYCFVSFTGYPGDQLKFCSRTYLTNLAGNGARPDRDAPVGECSRYDDEAARRTASRP